MFRYLKNENIQHRNKKGRSSFNISTYSFFKNVVCTRFTIEIEDQVDCILSAYFENSHFKPNERKYFAFLTH